MRNGSATVHRHFCSAAAHSELNLLLKFKNESYTVHLDSTTTLLHCTWLSPQNPTLVPRPIGSPPLCCPLWSACVSSVPLQYKILTIIAYNNMIKFVICCNLCKKKKKKVLNSLQIYVLASESEGESSVHIKQT